MTSKEALYLLMTNQKKVRDGFKFINLNTHEKVSIEECYDIVIKDLEVLEILKKHMSISNDYHFDNDSEECIECMLIEDLTIRKEEYDKVKEWLENGEFNEK